MKKLLCLLSGLILFFGGATPVRADPVDEIALDYAELALGAQLLQSPNVEVDMGLAEQLAGAKAEARTSAQIGEAAEALIGRLDALVPTDDAVADMRRRSLRARLAALDLGVRPPAEPLDIAEEVQRRFGFTPQFPALADYDATLAGLEATMPGEGTLPERIAAMRRSAAVPADRIEAVFHGALAECRRRTAAHAPLEPETVEVEFVDDDLTPAQTMYRGNGRSVVRISRVIPTDVDRLLQNACHEVYPGHHVHLLTLDRALYRARGWSEWGAAIDSEPVFPVAEAIAEHGVYLAFPVEERIAFQRDVLYPLAGLTMQDEEQWRAYLTARPRLLGSTATITRDFLTGAIDEETARALLVKYRLQTPEAAQQTIRMISAFGSFLIASDFGWYAVEQVMRGRSPEEQWALIRRMQSEPMLLSDVLALR